jgi:F-type H+-transporting ATPase subunit gamma
MPSSTRLIRRRVRSIASTRKIIKAMELVAAAKMRRATDLTLRTRAYSSLVQSLTNEVRKLVPESNYPFLIGRPHSNGGPLRTMVVVVASDRGLCGSFNSQIVRTTLSFLQRRTQDQIQLVTVGRRAEQAIRRMNLSLQASFGSISNAPSFERVHPIGTYITTEFLEGRVDRVFVIYTHYHSALRQTPTEKQVLPIIPEEDLEGKDSLQELLQEDQEEGELDVAVFEPSTDEVLQALLPRMVDMEVYQSFLEAAASEHSARMMAMKNAQEAAGEMLDDLVFTLNQARQSAITQEISEIAAGSSVVQQG